MTEKKPPLKGRIEWLKKQLRKGMKVENGKISFEYCYVGDKIDEAFKELLEDGK